MEDCSNDSCLEDEKPLVRLMRKLMCKLRNDDDEADDDGDEADDDDDDDVDYCLFCMLLRIVGRSEPEEDCRRRLGSDHELDIRQLLVVVLVQLREHLVDRVLRFHDATSAAVARVLAHPQTSAPHLVNGLREKKIK